MSIEPLQHPKAGAASGSAIDGLDAPPAAPSDNGDPASLTRSERRRDGRLRARRVTRVVRRVEPWSVLKVSAAVYLCVWLSVTVAGVLLWQVARATGTLDNFQNFLATALADNSFSIQGGHVLFAALLGGAVLVFAGSALTTLFAVLFNLVSELTGGVRVSVVELETAVVVAEDG